MIPTMVNRAEIWFLLSLVMIMSLLPGSLVRATEVCGVLVRNDQKSSARKVYLTNGKAWELFERYLNEAKKQGIEVSLWKTRVIISNGQERTEYALGWSDMVTGQGALELWNKLLRSVTAEIDEASYQNAEQQQWDIVCYGKITTEPSGPKTYNVPLAAKQHLDSGIQYAARRDFDNAILEFTLAIQQYEQYATAYTNRGVAYMQQRKYNKAMDDLKKAEELNPQDRMVYYNLMALYCVQNQRDRGLDALDKTLELGFGDYDALRKDRDLASCRRDPDFQKVLEKHKVFLQ